MARCENNYNHSMMIPEVNVRDYTMTLPASRGRHRTRVNGNFIHSNCSVSKIESNKFDFLQKNEPGQSIRVLQVPKMKRQFYAIDMLLRICYVEKVSRKKKKSDHVRCQDHKIIAKTYTHHHGMCLPNQFQNDCTPVNDHDT